MNDFKIDLKGLLVLYMELLALDLSLGEIKIIIYMITKIMHQSGHRVLINNMEVERISGLDRRTARNAVNSLKKKNLIIQRADRVEFTCLSASKCRNAWKKYPFLNTLTLLSELKEQPMKNMGKNVPISDELASAMYTATVTGEKNGTWVKLSEGTPIIYTHTYARTREANASAAACDFKVAEQVPFDYEETKQAHGLSQEDVDKLMEEGTIELGMFSYAVIISFNELGDFISLPRIHHVKLWLKELADIYGIESEKDMGWARKVIFEWKMYYRDPENFKALDDPQDYINTLTKFFANSKHK